MNRLKTLKNHCFALFLCFLILPFIAGCNRLVTYRLETKVYDTETKKPLANIPVAVKKAELNEAWGKDLHWEEEKFAGREFDAFSPVQSGQTNEQGVFISKLPGIVGGLAPVPQPHYLIRIGEPECSQLWGVVFQNDKTFELRKYSSSSGSRMDLPTDTSRLPNVKELSIVEATADIPWNHQDACAEVKILEKTSARSKPGHHIVFLSYADLMPRGGGFGYIYSIGTYGFLRPEASTTISNGSYSIAAMIKIRALPIWRFAIGAGIGAQYDHVDPNNLPGAHYISADTGFHAAFAVGLDYSPRNGFYFEGGYRTVTLAERRSNGHAYARVGWVF